MSDDLRELREGVDAKLGELLSMLAEFDGDERMTLGDFLELVEERFGVRYQLRDADEFELQTVAELRATLREGLALLASGADRVGEIAAQFGEVWVAGVANLSVAEVGTLLQALEEGTGLSPADDEQELAAMFARLLKWADGLRTQQAILDLILSGDLMVRPSSQDDAALEWEFRKREREGS